MIEIWMKDSCQLLKQSLVYFAFRRLCNEILSWINYAIWMKNHLVSDNKFCNIVDLQWPKKITIYEK
jgi:hypothetical protein